MKKIRRKEEDSIALKISEFLKIQYPNVIHRFDLSADIRLTIGQAVKVKKLQGDRGFPDLFIAKPNKGFCGLYIELKKNREEVFKKNGELKRRFNKKTGKCHNEEQSKMLERLNKEGYLAVYGFGFDETKDIIKKYLNG